MRKKVVAMGLAAMMAMSLAACSSGGSIHINYSSRKLSRGNYSSCGCIF